MNLIWSRKKAKQVQKIGKWLFQFALFLVVVFNLVAYAGAYSLTHFISPGSFGLGIPRLHSSRVPTDLGLASVTNRIKIGATEWLETWFVPVRDPDISKGTVILFPGNGSSKAKQLLNAVKSRLQAFGIPSFPLAESIVFWGGVQHGFNGFDHNPVTFASRVKCPTLLLHGATDRFLKTNVIS
jgi:hypothetical protein